MSPGEVGLKVGSEVGTAVGLLVGISALRVADDELKSCVLFTSIHC